MVKTSKVESVQGAGTFNDLYKYEVAFEDGTTGNMYKKSDNPYIKAGDEVNYTISDKGTIRIERDNKQAFSGSGFKARQNDPRKELLIVKQVCLKAAVELVKKNDPVAVIENAEIFVKWVMNEQETPKAIGKKEPTDLPF